MPGEPLVFDWNVEITAAELQKQAEDSCALQDSAEHAAGVYHPVHPSPNLHTQCYRKLQSSL